MGKLIKIGEASLILGVSKNTLRRWEALEKRLPYNHKAGETRYYDLDNLLNFKTVQPTLTYGYARVSSHDQKKDLETQAKCLAAYCIAHGWSFEIISDLGLGMNYKKKGLKRLIDSILNKKINRLVLTHKDRLLRFGAEIIFAICEINNIEVVIINQSEEVSFEQELAKDVLEIITVFSARLYGSSSHKNKKLIETVQLITK